MSHGKALSLKRAKDCATFTQTGSCEQKRTNFSNIVLLTLNLKKSPWLLSRCNKTYTHTQCIQNLVKEYDSLKVIVKLMRTTWDAPGDERYLVLISTYKNDEESYLLLGINVVKMLVTVGLILPITMDTDICLNGDGGFFVFSSEKKYSFQPLSIQEMWSALQALVCCIFDVRSKKLQHVPSEYYEQLPKSEPHQICEWERINDALSSKPPDIVFYQSKEKCQLKTLIRRKLQETLFNVDLETITSKEIRDTMEEKMRINVQEALGLSLSQYKQFIDEETILVMRQMDSPSQILDFLYLGSEWNASNFEELRRNRIVYILNVTKEIENFFPGMFKYCNVQVYDYEETELLKYWNNTFKFIMEAKNKNSNVLVHCKMGISRSASTVIAFIMKHHQWNLEQAYQFVKQKRSCIQPNSGFMQQLITYQGILDASNHRHNKLFRSRSIGSIDKTSKEQMTLKRVRPKSNAEEGRPKDEVDKVIQSSSEPETTDPSPGKFIIVDANDDCASVSDSCIPQADQRELSTFIDESTLSTSSVLRQWSIHSGGFQSTEKSEESGPVKTESGSERSNEFSLLPDCFFKRSASCPEELNINFVSHKSHDISPKHLVRFGFQIRPNLKTPMKRHHSMFQD